MQLSPEFGKALSGAFRDIQHATKNAQNPHFKSNYANLEEVLDVIRKAFSKHELAISQSPGRLLQENDRFKVEITTLVVHSSGGTYLHTMEMPVSPDKNGKISPHAVGSSISFGRRYALAAVAGITQSDDDGNAGSDGQEDGEGEETAYLGVEIQAATTLGQLRQIKSAVEQAGNESLARAFEAQWKRIKGNSA